MKILHTSDWHLGRALPVRKRYDEYDAFLNWLADLIESEDIDILLGAGDVFDNSTPSNHTQERYYRFLCRVAASPRRHVVATAGNHDLSSFLNAPPDALAVEREKKLTDQSAETLEKNIRGGDVELKPKELTFRGT